MWLQFHYKWILWHNGQVTPCVCEDWRKEEGLSCKVVWLVRPSCKRPEARKGRNVPLLLCLWVLMGRSSKPD